MADRQAPRARCTPRLPSVSRGFTLVELLVVIVVIVVIGILAAIAIPVFLSQADKASDASLKSDLTNAAKLLQVAEANGETLSSEITAGQVVDLGTAGTFTSNQSLTIAGSGETLRVEGVSDSGATFSADLANGLRDRDCAGIQTGALVTDGLIAYLDAADPNSYPGSGTTWTDISGENGTSGSLVGGVTHVDSYGGAFNFDGVESRIDMDPVANPYAETVIVWASSDTPEWNAEGWISSARTENGHIIHPNIGSTKINAYFHNSEGQYM